MTFSVRSKIVSTCEQFATIVFQHKCLIIFLFFWIKLNSGPVLKNLDPKYLTLFVLVHDASEHFYLWRMFELF